MPVTVTWNDPGPRLRAATGDAIAAGLAVIQADAQERVPVQEGDLKGSINIDNDTRSGTVYADTVYAARQHEELGWNHAEGEAKYLENALASQGQAALQAIADHLSAEL